MSQAQQPVAPGLGGAGTTGRARRSGEVRPGGAWMAAAVGSWEHEQTMLLHCFCLPCRPGGRPSGSAALPASQDAAGAAAPLSDSKAIAPAAGAAMAAAAGLLAAATADGADATAEVEMHVPVTMLVGPGGGILADEDASGDVDEEEDDMRDRLEGGGLAGQSALQAMAGLLPDLCELHPQCHGDGLPGAHAHAHG